MAKAKLSVIEVEKKHVSTLTAEQAAPFVARLRDDPGFQWLLSQLEVQRALLRKTLEEQRHKSITDVEFIQSGLNWLNWLRLQQERAVGIMNKPKERPARPYEQEAFEQLRHNVELVGLTNESDNSLGEAPPQG